MSYCLKKVKNQRIALRMKKNCSDVLTVLDTVLNYYTYKWKKWKKESNLGQPSEIKGYNVWKNKLVSKHVRWIVWEKFTVQEFVQSLQEGVSMCFCLTLNQNETVAGIDGP